MTGFSKIAASWLRLCARLVLPDTAELDQTLFTHHTKLHNVGRTFWLVVMILNTKSLEWDIKAIITICELSDRETKNGHAAVLFEPSYNGIAKVLARWP